MSSCWNEVVLCCFGKVMLRFLSIWGASRWLSRCGQSRWWQVAPGTWQVLGQRAGSSAINLDRWPDHLAFEDNLLPWPPDQPNPLRKQKKKIALWLRVDMAMIRRRLNVLFYPDSAPGLHWPLYVRAGASEEPSAPIVLVYVVRTVQTSRFGKFEVSTICPGPTIIIILVLLGHCYGDGSQE